VFRAVFREPSTPLAESGQWSLNLRVPLGQALDQRNNMAVQPLDQSTVQYWSIDSLPLLFPCQRLHVATDGGHWWEIRYLWAELARHECLTKDERHRSRWIRACLGILQQQTLFADLVLFHPCSSGLGHVNTATVSTVGILYICTFTSLIAAGWNPRNPAVNSICAQRAVQWEICEALTLAWVRISLPVKFTMVRLAIGMLL